MKPAQPSSRPAKRQESPSRDIATMSMWLQSTAQAVWANTRQETSHCWQLSYVPGRSRTSPKAGRLVRLARTAGHGGQDELATDTQGKRRCYGVPVGEPPSRLPHLRSRRSVRSARPVDALRCRPRTIPRSHRQASSRGQEHRSLDQNIHEQMHSLHEVYPLRK